MGVDCLHLTRVVRSFLVITLLVCSAAAADFKAGFGRRQITPPIPIWMAGFAARKVPADSVMHDLWTKALAVQDAKGGRLVVITVDLVTVPRSITDVVAARLHRRHGIERHQLLINFSHTHSGPALAWNSKSDRAMIRRIEEYREKVLQGMTDAALDALAGLKPARLSFGRTQITFSHNRREPVPGGGFRFGRDPDGPVDRSVPVIRVAGVDGSLQGVLFGLACHPSALTPEFHAISGDYAGVAQIALEKAHPGVTAMFMQLCGGNQTTYPRSKLELMEQYGRELATEVDKTLATRLQPLRSPLRIATNTSELRFKPYSVEMFEEDARSGDAQSKARGERMLKSYESGQPPMDRVLFGMQAVQFGRDLTLLAMNGEVVVEYALRVKKEFGENVIAAGYSNEIMSYIPTVRILREGGYEGRDALMRFPNVYSEEIEETILAAIRELMQKVGRPGPAQR